MGHFAFFLTVRQFFSMYQLCSLDENNKTALIMEMETLIVIKKRCIFIVESVSGSISESLNFLIAISQSVSRVVSQ